LGGEDDGGPDGTQLEHRVVGEDQRLRTVNVEQDVVQLTLEREDITGGLTVAGLRQGLLPVFDLGVRVSDLRRSRSVPTWGSGVEGGMVLHEEVDRLARFG